MQWGLCSIITLILALTAFSQPPLTPEPGSASQIQWIAGRDGQRTGLYLLSDLQRDSSKWELWGPGAGMPTLAPLVELLPTHARESGGFACNGGFWNESEHPVGLCAGQRGIHSSLSHPTGLAIAGGRGWIGAMKTSVTLQLENGAEETSPLALALNPRPLPRQTPYLIDPAAYPHPMQIDRPAQVVWLDRATTGPLRFNAVHRLTVQAVAIYEAGSAVPLAPNHVIMWVTPMARPDENRPTPPAIGDICQLRLGLECDLEPVEGDVRLACAAGPILVDGGEICEGLSLRRSWRTAVGLDATGHQMWLVMLARGKDGAFGATLQETAEILRDLGASRALNLDGGHSSTAWSGTAAASLNQLFPFRTPIHHGLYFSAPAGE